MRRFLARLFQEISEGQTGGFVTACLTLLERAYMFVAIVSLLGFIGIVFTDVICRQIFNYPLLVAGDLAILFFVWSVMAAAAVAARMNLHFAMDIVPKFRRAALNVGRGYLIDALILAFFLLLTVRGAQTTYAGFGRVFPMSGYPIGLAVAALPFAGIGASLFQLERLVLRYRGLIGAAPAAGLHAGDVS